MAQLRSKVSKALQATVGENNHIDFVHFDGNGDHYFRVHKFSGINAEEKELNGLYGRIAINHKVDKDGRKSERPSPIVKTKIIETATREDVLNAEPISDLLQTGSFGLSVEELEVINSMRNGEKAGKAGKAGKA